MYLKRKVLKIVKNISNMGLRQNIDYEYKNAQVFSFNKDEIENLASSNNIIRFKYENRIYYFKECRQHTSPKEYIVTVLNDFFGYICDFKEGRTILKLIFLDLENPANLKKIFNTYDYVLENYYIVKKPYSGWNIGKIGLPSLYREYMQKNTVVVDFMNQYGRKFIEYIKNEINAYCYTSFCKKGGYQIFRASLNIATKKLADKLGLSDMIPESKYIKIKIADGPEKFGFVTEHCEGISPLDLSTEEKENITPEFQRQLLNMNLFDALCFQRDHKQENYFVNRNSEGKICGVIAFDNDSPMTFFSWPSIKFITYAKCSPIVIKGNYNRPFVDKDFVDKIFSFTTKEICDTVYRELSAFQKWALGFRFKQLKMVLKNATKIEKNEWGNETIKKELEGSFGKTYLKHYLECNKNIDSKS